MVRRPALLLAIALVLTPTAVMASESDSSTSNGPSSPSSSAATATATAGHSASRRRALLQGGSAAASAVLQNVNCSALPGLQACAEPLCFDEFELRRNASSGSIECRPIPPAQPSALNLLLPIYDGDYIFLSTGDNALAATSVLDNTNTGRRFTTREGSLRVRAPFTERVRNAGSVFGGFLGRFRQERASTEVASSWAVGTNPQRPLQTETSLGTGLLPRVGATSKRGLYGPGFVAVGRGAAASSDPSAQGGSVEDNVALDVTAPFGLLGRRRRRGLLQQQQRRQQREDEDEDLAALRAQVARLVAKGAVKGDAMFDLRSSGGDAGEEGMEAAPVASEEEGALGGAQQQQQQPALRQIAVPAASLAASSGVLSSSSGLATPLAPTPLAPAILPFCRPRIGLFCSDTDLLRVLRKARPDAVLLSEDAPAWGEAFFSGEVDPRLLVRTDPIAGKLPAASLVANSRLDGRFGSFAKNGVVKGTLASTALGLAPAPAAVGAAPALALTVGQGRAEGTLEARQGRGRLVIFPGANFGSLAGLTQVEATQG
jgi:hypothetical protein